MKIYANRIDNRYDMFVEHTGPLKGELVVALNGKELAREPVSITADARFGVDAGDEAHWLDRSCEIIDALPKVI